MVATAPRSSGRSPGPRHVNTLAEAYGARVILHTDHCAKGKLGWVDGLLDAGEEYFAAHGRPLFSSHMLDLSEEPMEENVATCKKYLERMAPIGMTLEIELGITGGEEDGVDNTGADQADLYSKPEEVEYAYSELIEVSDRFTIAAAFGNVHGVYKPGNVKLAPEHPARQPGVHRRQARHGDRQAGRLRVPRRIGFDRRRDRRGDLLRRGQDEHRHRPAVGAVGRDPPVRGRASTTTCRARSATRTGRTSRTRRSMTRGCGCAAARSRSAGAWSWRSRSSTTSGRWPVPEARDCRHVSSRKATRPRWLWPWRSIARGQLRRRSACLAPRRRARSRRRCASGSGGGPGAVPADARSTPRATTPGRSTAASAR